MWIYQIYVPKNGEVTRSVYSIYTEYRRELTSQKFISEQRRLR